MSAPNAALTFSAVSMIAPDDELLKTAPLAVTHYAIGIMSLSSSALN